MVVRLAMMVGLEMQGSLCRRCKDLRIMQVVRATIRFAIATTGRLDAEEQKNVTA